MQKLSKILFGLALTTMVSASIPEFDLAKGKNSFTLITVEDRSAMAIVSINGVAPKSISIVEDSANPNFTVSGQNITFNIPSEYRFRSGIIAGLAITATDSKDQSMTRDLTVEVQPIGFFGGIWKSVWDPAWGVSKIIYEVQHADFFQRGFFWNAPETTKK